VLCEAGIVFGVDDCEFSLREGDFSERIAIAEAAVSKQDRNKRCLEPIYDVLTVYNCCRPRRKRG
jgi:hypothetical protein